MPALRPLPKDGPGRRKVMLWSRLPRTPVFDALQHTLPGGRLVAGVEQQYPAVSKDMDHLNAAREELNKTVVVETGSKLRWIVSTPCRPAGRCCRGRDERNVQVDAAAVAI